MSWEPWQITSLLQALHNIANALGWVVVVLSCIWWVQLRRRKDREE